jgi:hypothetical protein
MSKIAAMMVGSEFPGDNNDTLMDSQHAAYGEMVVRLFTGPHDRLMGGGLNKVGTIGHRPSSP